MKKNFEINNPKIIYPMSMLSEVVGNERTVRIESACYEFDSTEPYFHYAKGNILESLSERLAKFSMETMGYAMYAE